LPATGCRSEGLACRCWSPVAVWTIWMKSSCCQINLRHE
jgi:hypothetical protein